MKVFISHHSSQVDTAARVAGYLEARGIPCWFAPRDIPIGAEWDQAIQDAINAAPALVLLLSAEADSSRHVKRELTIADSHGVKLYWLRLQPADLAMPPGRGDISSFHGTADQDLREVLLSAGAGAWQEGTLELALSAADGKSVAVRSVEPHIIRTDLPSPLWVEDTYAECGGSTARVRNFLLALDVPTMIDGGLAGAGASPDDSSSALDRIDEGLADLGPDFLLTGTTQGSINVKTVACSGNYEWTVDVAYAVAGDPHQYVVTVGPYKTYGRSENTSVYLGRAGSDGQFHLEHTTIKNVWVDTFAIALEDGVGGPIVSAPDPEDPAKTLYFCNQTHGINGAPADRRRGTGRSLPGRGL